MKKDKFFQLQPKKQKIILFLNEIIYILEDKERNNTEKENIAISDKESEEKYFYLQKYLTNTLKLIKIIKKNNLIKYRR